MEILATIGGSAQGLIERLPRFVRSRLDGLTLAALNRAFAAATRTRRYVRDRGDWFNRLASTVSGAAGGVAGLPGAMIELPVTVTMLLRAILDIAEEHGLDPESDEVRIEALRVFAAAGPMSEDDGTDLGLLAAKLSITGQTVQGIIARIAPRLAAVLGQKLAAQATPVFGALAGASINYTFARYYQEIARVHFGVLRLSQETGLPREALTEERRAAEIYRIQRDIARRRRRNLALLLVRLAFFVGLPTIVAGWYYFTQATKLYATTSQFMIQQAEGVPGVAGASITAGAMMNPDNVAVQSYLTSRDAMIRLDDELGFTRAFQDPAIDKLLRLPQDATREEAYALYQDSVKIGYDPTEGVINMEVIAPDPQLSEQFSLALIRYAEGQVDQMTARLREDQMQGAASVYADAEKKVQEAQLRVQQLQEKLGVLDPSAEGGVVMGQIATLEGQLAEKRLELGQLQSNARPNQSRVQGVQGDIARLEKMIADVRSQLTEESGNRASLAAISGELRVADSDLVTRQQLLATAAEQMETARIEANKQVRYLSLSVAPVPPDAATYPQALQNTIVAFLVFAGIYLMMSLTASILREQVSS